MMIFLKSELHNMQYISILLKVSPVVMNPHQQDFLS